MKPTPIEKFQYLVHLRATNVHLFYRLLSENVKASHRTRTANRASHEPLLTDCLGIDPSDLHSDRR